jgi:hypothetical protein
MELHNLINMDDPVCLYCQAYCDVFQDAKGYPPLVTNAYTCQKCKEKFEMFVVDGSNVKYIGFSFTCNHYKVWQSYINNKLGLANISFDAIDYIWVPYFEVDFSKKEELYKKIKTYILFA